MKNLSTSLISLVSIQAAISTLPQGGNSNDSEQLTAAHLSYKNEAARLLSL